MRFKVILPAFVVAILILLPAIYLRHASVSPPPAPPAADQTSASPAPQPSPHLELIPSRSENRLPPPQDEAADTSAPDHPAYVVERKSELLQLGMSDDPADLKTILSELNNPDPEIRKTALIATVDFGSQDAIPTLKNEVMWTDDPQEKIDLQSAIDFLQLPPVQVNEAASVTQQSVDPPPSN
jgi:hypothetical protein